MKQILLNLKSNFDYRIRVLLIPVLLLLTFTNFASAQGPGITVIPDPIFEQKLIDLLIDSDGVVNGLVLTSDINTVTSLDLSNSINPPAPSSVKISNLTGIEAFTSLTSLNCQNNNLTSIAGVYDLTSLTDLNASFNRLTSIDVSALTSLTSLNCQDNNLTGIDVSALTSLTSLNCQDNNLTSIASVSGLTSLTDLNASFNSLTSIDVSALTSLTSLDLWTNQLTSLDVSANTLLTFFGCDQNLLTSVDVSALTNLVTLYVSFNDLTSLDLRGLSDLSIFDCNDNPRLSCILVNSLPVTYIIPVGGIDPTTQFCTLTTYSGGSWSPATPTATNSAVIESDYSVSADITACSLTVKNNATVTIPSTFNVNLAGALTVEAGSSFTLSNNSNLDQTNTNNTNSGAITVTRNSNALKRQDYTLWSSPVVGQNLLAFSPQTLPNRFYSYDPANSVYDPIASPSTTPFTVGRGYLIRMPDNADADIPTPYAGSFTGVPNNGTVTVPLTIGYNLVGNPYPSNISFSTLQTDNPGLIGTTAYFWRKTNGTGGSAYCTYNSAGPTYVSNLQPGAAVDFDGTIQSGQGFFVNATAAGNLNFTNLQRTGTTANQAFFKTKRKVNTDKIWLNATNAAGDFSQMAVTYSDGATVGVDDYDSKSINDSQYALTSIIEGVEFTIQGRPAFDTVDVVALNFKTAATGNFTIALARAEGVFAIGQDAYLVDNTTGVETNLKAGAYNFTANAGVDNSRFTLKYQKTLKVDALAFNEDSLTVYSNDGTLYINSGVTAIQNIKVFDIQGRLVGEQKNVKANTASISNLKANQALIVQITSEDNIVVNKKVVN